MINWDALVGTPVTGVFGQAVTYMQRKGATFSLIANWTEGSEDQSPIGEGVELTVTPPMLGAQLSAFPTGVAPKQGDRVQTVNPATGVFETFVIKDVRPDGQGGVFLALQLSK